jgi:hypothetical protein
MSNSITRALGLAAALLITLLLAAPAALAAAPDPVAACDGTAHTATTVAGRAAVACDDGRVRDWQRARVADARVVRGSSGGATLAFTVTRPEAGNPLALDYATADGDAIAGVDYSASSGQLVLEADETSATIAVPVASRATAGSDLRMALRLSDPSGVALLERDHASGWILNRFYRPEQQPDAEYMCDGGFYSLGSRPEGGRAVLCLGRIVTPIVSAGAVDPQAGVATFTIARPAELDDYGSYWMRYATQDGSARAGVDYTAVSGRVALLSYQRTVTVTVPVDPAAAGAGRTFSLGVSTDSPSTTVGVYDAVARATVPVRGTATLQRPGASIDGAPKLGQTLTAAAGADAYAWWRCDAAGACLAIPGASGRAYSPVAADLGQTLRVRTTTAEAGDASQYAEAGASGPVTAAAIDPVAACDGTAFTTSTVDGRAVVACDDGAIRGWQRVAVEDARVARGTAGGATLAFAIRRPEAGSPLFLRARTAGGTAVAGSDYTALDGIVVLEADETSTTVELPVTSRASATDDVTVELALADEAGAGIEFARDRATGVIANSALTTRFDADEACDGGMYDVIFIDGLRNPRCLVGPAGSFTTVAASSPAVDRLAGVVTFELTRLAGGGRTWVSWETVDGSARAGVDYVAASGTALLSGDQRRARVAVPLLAPAGADGDRSFTLRLSDGRAAQPIAATDGSATIRGGAPALAGTPRAGQPLDGAAPGALARQWQRCDALGACWPIAGATGAGYTPTAADVGFGLRVRASFDLGVGGAQRIAFTPTSAAVLPALPRPGPDPIHPADPRPLPTVDPDSGTRPRPTADPAPGPRPAEPQPQPQPRPGPAAEPQPAPGATLVISGRRQQNRSVALVAAGRANLWLRCSVACRIDAPLTISKATARRLGLRSTTVGHARGTAAAGELARLRVTLHPRAKVRVVRIAGRLRVIATVATPGGGAVRVSFGLNPVPKRT